MARNTKLPGITDPYSAELLAVRDAVRLAMEMNWKHVIIETDCQTIRDEWESADCRSMGSTVIREIKSYIPNFQGLSIHYARREANDAAHCCAKEGLVTASSVVTYAVIPAFLIATMQSDVNRLIIE